MRCIKGICRRNHNAFLVLIQQEEDILFRVDGNLPETVFVMLGTLFFYNNDIILEFFEIDNLDTFLLENNELE